MPYIKKEDREKFKISATDIADKAECAGDLNFAITVILHTYLKRKGIKYANINEIMGMMECAKLEFYRMISEPYEDLKIMENGDIDIIKEEDLNGKKY